MRMESHASPTRETPHQRYAALHRAIERGLVSDAVWKELAEVSLSLGHTDECARCVRQIENPTLRKAIESRLARLAEAERNRARPLAAPAASSAGVAEAPRPHAANHADDDRPPGIAEHLTDALQYLMLQHMPWLCLVTVLAFPLVVGLGGFLTAGTPPLAFAAIAALPSLCVLAVIGAMARRILVESSHGVTDVPGLPALGELTREALRFGGDALLVLLACALPGGLTWAFSRSLPATAAVFGVTMALAPMAFVLRQLRGGWSAVAPWRVVVAAARGGPSYLALATACWTLLTPAGLVAWKVGHQPVWLQIATIGPAVALPVFFVARLLGTWADVNRACLGKARSHTSAAAAAAAAPPAAAPTAAPQPAARTRAAAPGSRPAVKTTQPRRPARQPSQAAPARQPAAAAQPTRQPRQRPAPAAPVDAPAPHAIEGRRPQPQPTPSPSPSPQASDQPDLSAMPGAVKVTGKERVRAGAAVRRS